MVGTWGEGRAVGVRALPEEVEAGVSDIEACWVGEVGASVDGVALLLVLLLGLLAAAAVTRESILSLRWSLKILLTMCWSSCDSSTLPHTACTHHHRAFGNGK